MWQTLWQGHLVRARSCLLPAQDVHISVQFSCTGTTPGVFLSWCLVSKAGITDLGLLLPKPQVFPTFARQQSLVAPSNGLPWHLAALSSCRLLSPQVQVASKLSRPTQAQALSHTPAFHPGDPSPRPLGWPNQGNLLPASCFSWKGE